MASSSPPRAAARSEPSTSSEAAAAASDAWRRMRQDEIRRMKTGMIMFQVEIKKLMQMRRKIQGAQSSCALGAVNIKTKVAF